VDGDRNIGSYLPRVGAAGERRSKKPPGLTRGERMRRCDETRRIGAGMGIECLVALALVGEGAGQEAGINRAMEK
jgi:hypothetical protein